MRRILGLTAAATVVVFTATACGGTGGSGSDDTKPAANAAPGSAPAKGSGSVTVYSVDGLADWYTKRFADFEKKTGIKVNLVESGSGEVVTRMEKEKGNPQADVAITLPPFIQRAAQADLLTAYAPAGADKVPATSKDAQGRFVAVVNNYASWIYNPDRAKPAPTKFQELTDGRFKSKLQYSTPGQAGDGTAVLIQLQHLYGKQGALDYLKRLESNNVGPSSSTGKLQPKVGKGELSVANGDLQMNLASIHNDKSDFKVWFPADDAGKASTFALPYFMGLSSGAPHADAGRKLMDYLLSPEAQTSVSADALGLPAREDVKPTDANAAEIAKALEGVEIWAPDWDTVLKDLDADLTAYNKAVGR
ncbi:2-aminoethylphosphonate ABC transporter substrate-binding protein [Embleya scabrispora]|uniref:2-aminoethylphosphonate ABC transporter substrate-binding protein n=1 Tax=Embleya scabrispora TaxID=159449 RepID=UPI00035DDEC3|nr:2-aminoethylphosphonate ABC transporter substrate-binding protein [Embleya scabrispora]MYS79659.1 2-aminoethylphosphonate ABC transporter substrate-binding protein [Streptomyces sp. SID5474]